MAIIHAWTEKYRPQTITDCILPAETKASLQSIVVSREIPNLLLVGYQGTGKTTVAKALCQDIGAEFLFVNGSKDAGIDVLRTTIERFASSVSFYEDGPSRKYVILDEADYLNPASTQPALRSFMEQWVHNCGFILTANFPNKLLPPIRSRCSEIRFDIPKGERATLMGAMLSRLVMICDQEHVQADKPMLAGVIKKYFPDFRKVLTELQRHSQTGVLSPAILSHTTDTVYTELIQHIKTKKFDAMRQWITAHLDDPGAFYSTLFGRLESLIVPTQTAQVIIIVNDYAYKNSFVVDYQLNAAACCTELMAIEGLFK